MTIEELVVHLRGRRSGHGWSCHCPSHEDKTPSLWVSQKDDGGIFVNCQAGCSSEQVLAALDQ
jgi:DNA primase